MSYLKSALIALQFLTQIPVTFKQYPDVKVQGGSLIFYPLIGLFIGALLSLSAWLLADSAQLLSAAIILTIWVVITGALHIDGLADSCDAWIGGHGDKKRSLEIMKDPASGPIAVVMVVCLLLLKLAAIHAVLASQNYLLLIAAPLIARSLLPFMLLLTPYVRENGIGAQMVANAPKQHVYISATIGLVIASLIGSLSVTLLAGLSVIGLRSLMIKRLDGLTGDTAGASVELLETVVVMALVITLGL